ncbi:pyruvate ferredoxin oxidoreductase alpha subunit [Caloramator quimbayensis]|uniref:Pyruvate ferredoxin oxidoreductase alpha subunit n=1 Tax=Caloramator quimbayensis TaxID=1147123 RepID=A0A1T4WQ26_9CLOT|nr:pyruvate ferredoxin oxidoreductase [Caloramator quimbayensis]SKA79217.1 pyruvate ferredoxin oxidoreductase alpha subunit [Caloramator quimbayensis]
MAKRVSLSGNEAVAFGMKQINPDVVAAFPITPSTEVPQYFSQFVANGQVDTEFVPVESEHSAMSACLGAAAAGGRVMTATASAGLALMWEMLYVGASMRTPLVLAVTNRALSGPINIHNDHSDTMGARDSGWIQLYSESAQEAYDNLIQAVRIGEHKDVQLPVMVCYDGFITSHAVENLEMLEDADVKNFVGENRIAPYALLGKEPMSMGPLDLPNHYFEHKRLQAEAMKNAKNVILEVAAEYEKLSGRKYSFFEEYKMEDAEAAIVVINSTAGTAKYVVDNLRAQGKKVGLIKIRVFRPFPAEEIAKALKNVKAVAIMDKLDGFSASGGPLFNEVRSAMYGVADGKIVTSYIYGLGGRDVTSVNIEKVYSDLFSAIETGKYEVYNYLGVRE